MKVIDIVGTKVGRWTVMSRAQNTKQGQAQYLCRCECGNEKVVKSIILRRQISRSCGCLLVETTIKRSTKHGHSPMYGKISPTYHTWSGMKARCTNPKNNHFQRYGARGIHFCERWMTFENFLADMGEKPEGCSLDRIDNNRGYEPGNCRWATHTQQANNKGCNRLLTLNGVTKTMKQWSKETGINYGTLQDRLVNGWSDAEALTVPVAHKFKPAETSHSNPKNLP